MTGVPRAIVVGAGPGGLAAATTLVRRGIAVTIVDRYDLPGGQIGRQRWAGSGAHGPWAGLLAVAAHPRTSLLARTAVVALRRTVMAPSTAPPADGTDPSTSATSVEGDGHAPAFEAIVETDGRLHTMPADAIVLATGSREVVMPFPGWTLPGVVTAGAVQALIKREGRAPWDRIGLAGSGPLLLAVAQAMREAGQPPVFTLEAQPLADLARAGARTALTFPAKAALFGRLAGAHPPRFGWRVIEAAGDDRVRAAVIARTDRHGRDRGHRTIAVDALAVSSRLVPDVSVGLQLGCATRASADGVATAVSVDVDQQTSTAGVYAAGEITGVGGADKSIAEGRLAGEAAAARLLGASPPIATTLRADVARWRRFAADLERLYPVDHRWADEVDDHTIVCRCEEVPMGEVRRAIADGAHSARTIKGLTRTGMGLCQGAVCSSIVRSSLLAAGHTDTGDLESRPLAAPVALGELARLAPSPG